MGQGSFVLGFLSLAQQCTNTKSVRQKKCKEFFSVRAIQRLSPARTTENNIDCQTQKTRIKKTIVSDTYSFDPDPDPPFRAKYRS